MSIDAIAADANVLLSCIVGKAALRIVTDFDVRIHATEFNADEVKKYLPIMAKKYDLPSEIVELQWKLLPICIHPLDDYRDFYADAHRDLKDRDPDDAHALALARSLKLPLWSNDRDLNNLGVKCFSTARLLKKLESRSYPEISTNRLQEFSG